MKTVKSAGTLIKSKNKYLLCHATDLRKEKTAFFDKRWSIPKGLIESSESDYDCAVRETQEETGLNLVSLKVLPELEVFKELHYKSIHDEYGEVMKHLVVYLVNDEEGVLQHESLICHSMIRDTERPEMDAFKWVTVNQAKAMCYSTLGQLFRDLS